MIYLICGAAVALFGVCYAAMPQRFLKRKYPYEDEIPAIAIRTARIVGVVLAVLGAASIIYNLTV